ncbi:33576_t:CDS:2, partial [Gigaspora margarita]
ITKRHIKNIREFKKEDLELVKKMKDVGFRLISEKLGNDESPITSDKYLMGFSSPFNTVFHVHMHVLSKPLTCSWIRSLAYENGWFFKNVDEVIANLSS